MSALTPLAVQNAAVLRALAASPVLPSAADLARLLGRDDANLRKSLKALAAAGLLHPEPLKDGLTEAGHAAVAALDRAEGPAPAAPAIEGVAQLLHGQIAPDPLNPRKHFDAEAIGELADSIAQDGLLENLVVRAAQPGDVVHAPGGDLPLHRLVAGERRWRAIHKLIADGRWPVDRPILCKVVEIDDAAHRRLALVENLQRKDLRPIDEAEALQALMQVTQQGTAEVAKEIGFTQRFVQQRLQLLQLPATKRDALNEGGMTIEQARRWIAARPKLLEDLTPHQLLVMLEVAWEVAKSSNGWWTTIPCDWRARLDAEALKVLGYHEGYAFRPDARPTIALSSPAYGHLITLTNADDKLTRALLEPHLRKARLAVLPRCNPLAEDYDPKAFQQVDELFKAKRHVTPWLNGPFEVDPEIKAEADRRAAQRTQNEAENAEEAQRREAHEADQAAKRAAAKASAVEILKGFQARAWDGAALKAVFADAGRPLPWRWVEDPRGWDSRFQDANGEDLYLGDNDELLMPLIMAALNAAVDEPPLVHVEIEDDDDSDDGPEGEHEEEADDDAVEFIDEDEAEGVEAAADAEVPDYLARLAGGAPAEARP